MSTPARLLDRHADPAQRQLAALGRLLALEKRARQASSPQELCFLMVNETLGLVRYRQAALWRRDARGEGEIVAASGLATLEPQAPFIVWLRRLCAARAHARGGAELECLTSDSVDADAKREWGEWFPKHALWMPLCSPEGELLGALMLARDDAWSEADRLLLDELAGVYSLAWAYRLRGSRPAAARWISARRNRLIGAALAAALCAGFLPMRDSTLGAAEVIARDPIVLRAPIDGVVDEVLVEPNQIVEQGQLLLRLDDARLRSELEIAQQALSVAQAEHRQVAQQALFDPRAKAELVALQGRMDQHAAQVDYLNAVLERIEVRAPRAGVAVFDDVNDWIGKPVRTGERILMVAEPADMALEVRLPVADTIALKPGDEVRLFLNVDPHHPVPATLTYIGYQAAPGPDGVFSYRLKAVFDDERLPPRVGLKGTAKLYGERTTLFTHVFRRPISALRQRFGL